MSAHEASRLTCFKALDPGRGCFIDVKSVFDPTPFRKEGLTVWRL